MNIGFNSIALSLSVVLAGQSLAQEPDIIPDDITTKEVKLLGWDNYLGLGLYGTINQSNNVPGKDDGQSTTIGLKVDGAVDWTDGQAHWLNSMNLLVSYSRTPLIDNYIKADDSLNFDTLYKYYFDSFNWLGLFAQANLGTAIFSGFDTQAEPVTYRKVSLDGSVELITADRVKLTDGFKPLLIRESFGLLASPVKSEVISVDFKLGFGLRQVFADGQYILDDNEDTAERELREIKSYTKAGYEVGTEIKGAVEDKKVTYQLKASVLFPVQDSLAEDGDDEDLFAKRVLDLTGRASFHLVSWASVDYLLNVQRDPGISDKAQVSQSLLFSINKVLADRRKVPEVESPAAQ